MGIETRPGEMAAVMAEGGAGERVGVRPGQDTGRSGRDRPLRRANRLTAGPRATERGLGHVYRRLDAGTPYGRDDPGQLAMMPSGTHAGDGVAFALVPEDMGGREETGVACPPGGPGDARAPLALGPGDDRSRFDGDGNDDDPLIGSGLDQAGGEATPHRPFGAGGAEQRIAGAVATTVEGVEIEDCRGWAVRRGAMVGGVGLAEGEEDRRARPGERAAVRRLALAGVAEARILRRAVVDPNSGARIAESGDDQGGGNLAGCGMHPAHSITPDGLMRVPAPVRINALLSDAALRAG